MSREIHDGAAWVIDAIDRALGTNGGEGTDIARGRLAEQNLAKSRLQTPEPRGLPACEYLPQTIAASIMVADSVGAALADVASHLRWKQNSNYSDELLGKGYMQSYAYCEFIGPDGFYPGDDFLMGLLILGPGRLYKDHFHPAPELYWTLTGPALWRRGAEDFVTRPGGSTIWHAPNVVHATRTLEEPLLAVWIWTKDTAYPAKLVDV